MLLFTFCFLSLVGLVLQFPTVVLGIFISPLTKRMQWLVEFLYPYNIARWGHLLLVKSGMRRKCGVILGDTKQTSTPLHSRSIELRIEVVKGRVYIHPLPQLLDNIGYLIVCIPPNGHSGNQLPKNPLKKNQKDKNQSPSIIGILVDVGDADTVMHQVELIRDVHYANVGSNLDIEIHAVLCTHKHHDHTAGNKSLLSKLASPSNPKVDIYGGAVERVPCQTKFMADATFVDLPSVGTNILSDLIEIECISVPSHTRGSIVYALRNKPFVDAHNKALSVGDTSGSTWLTGQKDAKNKHFDLLTVSSYLFTGDAMFSGGGGVAFESDLEFPKDLNPEGKTVYSSFKPNAGTMSIERCFAQVLRRGISDADAQYSSQFDGVATHQMLVFPGHEYTFELLHRQMSDNGGSTNNSQWNRHQPSVFFELASQYFIAGHKRNIPKSTRLLTVPSTMKNEIKINPYFRSLKKRGEHLISAIDVWYNVIYKQKKKRSINDGTVMKQPKGDATIPTGSIKFNQSSMQSEKTPSSQYTWNVNCNDFNRSIFTTLYTSDLQEIIDAMRTNKISTSKAAEILSRLHLNLEESTVNRRPIPNTLPSEKKMYLGLLALATLGSVPSGLTSSDSDLMNLPHPVSSDHLKISKSTLISVLFRLGLISMSSSESEHKAIEIIRRIELLWDDAQADHPNHELSLQKSVDLEDRVENDISNDLVELGVLKLSLYAVTYNQPSWFPKYCMPCKRSGPTSDIKRSGGELVKHDATTCKMCIQSLGCPVQYVDRFIGEQDDDLSLDDLSVTD